jgi:hypothetical protein
MLGFPPSGAKPIITFLQRDRMSTPLRLIGYLLQAAGMLVMLYGFFTLFLSIQSVLSQVTGSMGAAAGVTSIATNTTCQPGDGSCGIDVTKDGAIDQIFSGKINTYLYYVGIGLGLVILGLILRAGDEIGGFISGMRTKQPQEQQRVRIGRIFRDL